MTSRKIDMQAVEKKIIEFSTNKFWAESSAVIASTLSDSWNNRSSSKFRIPELRFKGKKGEKLLFKLSILSWYLPEECRFVIQDAIHNQVRNNIDLIHIKFSLYSKDMMLRVLEDELSELHPNQVFGNFLNKEEWNETFFSSSIHFIRKVQYNPELDKRKVKAKRTIGVGYNDKGTLPESWKPKISDFQDDALHKKILQRRQTFQTVCEIYEEYLLSS